MENQENSPLTPVTGSIPLTSKSPFDWDIRGDQRALGIMAHEITRLKEQVTALKNAKVEEIIKLPAEQLHQLGLIDKPTRRLRRGRGSRPLMQGEIEEAKRNCITEASAARWLGVGYLTYRKYCKMYGIWNPKPNLRGKKNIFNPSLGKYPLEEILEGKHPKYPVYRLKDKLIRSGTKKAECEQCGFSERRVTDGKMPIIINFLDGNRHNHKLDNIKILCYNCTFTSGTGYIRRGTKYFDPDYMQGAGQDEIKDSRF